MLKRSITGIIFAAVMLFGTTVNLYFAGFLFVLIFLLSAFEWQHHFVPARTQKWIFIAACLIISVMMILMNLNTFQLASYTPIGLSLLSIIFIFISIMYTFKIWNIQIDPFPWYAGIIYLSIPFILCIYFLHQDFDEHKKLLISFIILNWSNDTFAYFTGRAFGKTKLAESISPKKTREGALGGLLGCLLVGFILNKFYISSYYSPIVLFLLAFCIWLFGLLGDLFESRLKRSIDIKDSGHLLPGHGGFLDRFDSFYFMIVFAIFITYLYSH